MEVLWSWVGGHSAASPLQPIRSKVKSICCGMVHLVRMFTEHTAFLLNFERGYDRKRVEDTFAYSSISFSPSSAWDFFCSGFCILQLSHVILNSRVGTQAGDQQQEALEPQDIKTQGAQERQECSPVCRVGWRSGHSNRHIIRRHHGKMMTLCGVAA